MTFKTISTSVDPQEEAPGGAVENGYGSIQNSLEQSPDLECSGYLASGLIHNKFAKEKEIPECEW